MKGFHFGGSGSGSMPIDKIFALPIVRTQAIRSGLN